MKTSVTPVNQNQTYSVCNGNACSLPRKNMKFWEDLMTPNFYSHSEASKNYKAALLMLLGYQLVSNQFAVSYPFCYSCSSSLLYYSSMKHDTVWFITAQFLQAK
jgi:hypothetical protein